MPKYNDDLISRHDAIAALCDNCDNVKSVCPHYPCKQYAAINALLPTQPEQKKGTWIWGYDIRCSNCNYKLQTTGLPSRCPNCGANMVGTAIEALQESEIIQCKDCKWWTKQPDSLQGRCAQFATYPTGAWYCGNAWKREENENE